MRASLTHLSRNKTLLVGLVAATVLALVGTATAYAAMSRTVTLSVDGKEQEVRTFAKDVGAVLASQGIKPGSRDVVVPAVDAQVNDGSRIAVRLARPLDLTVDGEKKTFWTTATKVSAALDQIGMRIGTAAELSVSRGASIDRSGMALEVVTPKRVSVQVANAKAERHNIAAATVGELLAEVKANVDRDDVVRPSRGAALTDGTRVVVTKIGVKTKRVAREAIPAPVRKEKDSSMMSGETKTVREGRDGARDVTYKIRFRNGQVVQRTIVRQAVVSQPVAGIVKVGTKTVNTGVWDAIAACESGGNWSANTGNGYYGGLQFLPSTFAAYGGSGMPHQNSREQQIAVAERVAAAEGGYGAWPHCGAKFG